MGRSVSYASGSEIVVYDYLEVTDENEDYFFDDSQELNDKAYSVLSILKRSTPLMDGLENAKDEEIIKVCNDIVEYLRGN